MSVLQRIDEWDRRMTAPLARRVPWLGFDAIYARRDDPDKALLRPWRLLLQAFLLGACFTLALTLPVARWNLIAFSPFIAVTLVDQVLLRRKFRKAGIDIPANKQF